MDKSVDMPKVMVDFIAEIKKFGISKASRLSGVTVGTIWEWTAGKRIPTLVNAAKVADAMGLEFLLFDKE